MSADLEPGLEAGFPTRPCLGGCGLETRAVELYGSVFPQMCDPCRAAADAAEAEAERSERVERLLAAVKLGSRIKAWSAESFPSDAAGRKALAAGRGWLEAYRAGSRAGLLVFGPVGTGKTGLAWSLVRELIEEDLAAANMVVFRDLLAEIRESFDRRGRERASTSALRSVEVLFLDDLGAERATDWARDELATLIEWRYQRGLVTGVTSNYEPGELARRLGHDDRVVGERILSRLTDGAVQIRVGGKDRRG